MRHTRPLALLMILSASPSCINYADEDPYYTSYGYPCNRSVLLHDNNHRHDCRSNSTLHPDCPHAPITAGLRSNFATTPHSGFSALSSAHAGPSH